MDEVIILLDEMITSKQTYLDKKPNNFIAKEIESLKTIKETFKLMNHLMTSVHLSYKLLLKQYEIDFKGKINPDNYASLEEWLDNVKRLTGEISHGS